MRSSGGLVCQGIIDGTNGTDGYNTVVVPLYRRSASVLTDNNRPSGTLTYTFSTGRVTGASTYFNGWSQTIPTASANTKLYVIMAVARSQSDTDEIAATDWSTPVEYVADGMSSAPVFIYKRAAIQPTDKPADGAVYTFATGALTGTLNGWSTNIPATDNNHYPCWVRQAMAVSRGTTDTINADEWSNPATKLVEDGAEGTSPYFADLDNEMDCVACTHAGNTSSAYDKTINLKLWHGSSPMDLTKLSYKVNNGTEYTTEQTINNIKVTPNSSAKTIRIRVENNKPLAETNDITIIIAGTGSGDQTLHFILNGVRAGANGDPVTLYSLLPSMDVVTKDKNGVPTLDLMTFKIIKRVGTTETEITTVSQFSTEGLSLFYKKGNNSEVEVTTSYMSDYGTSINYHDIESLYDGYSGVIDWVLRKNNTLLDREGIGSVQNGATGDMGYSIALTLTRNNLYTEANWNTYAEIGHSESYSKRTGDSDLTTCRVGDYFVVTGKASDSLLTHTATYKCTSVSASSITGTCISHTHDGANGDDAVTYQIVYSEAWAKVNSSNIISARLRGHAYKIVGSTRTAMAGATIMMGYVLNNTSSQYPNTETTTDANGYFSENDWFNGDEYGSSGYVQGSQVIFAAIVVNNIVKCVEYITMTLAGAKGDTGRMFYLAGEWDSDIYYTRNEKICPIVHCKVDNVNEEYWYLDANSSQNNPPSDSSVYWKKAQNFGIVLTEALFAQFAKLGSFIVAGDFFISQCGVLVAKDSTKVINGNLASSKQYYSNGINVGYGMPAYMYFDANDPMAEDVLPGTNNTFAIHGNNEMDGVFVRCIYFYASAATTMKVTITPSSEANYDFGCVGRLDESALSGDNVDSASISDGDIPTLVIASGTTSQSATVSVSKGAHFVEIAYVKDSSGDSDSDMATFKFEEVSNNYIGGFSEMKFRPKKVVNARTGEEWMAGGKVRVDKNGNVSLHDLEANDIIVNDATIKGGLMYNKVVSEYNYSSLALAETNGSVIHTAMKANIFVIGYAYSPFNVSFPPAYLFPGAQVKLVLGFTELITLNLFITRLSEEQAKYPADQYAAGWPPYNAFFAAIPIKNSAGTTIIGRFDSIDVNKYRSIDLVSVQNTGVGQRDYYYWMIVDAKE